MRTITKEFNVYTFEELTEEQQQKAIENYWDINVDFEWWDSLYDDAEMIGLKITEFDLDRNRYAKGDFINSALETANAIIEQHGEHCDTYQTAKRYLASREVLVAKYSEGTDQVTEDNEYEFDQECDNLDSEFLRSLCEDYLIILQEEYEYLTSEEAIKETLTINECEFTEDGKFY